MRGGGRTSLFNGDLSRRLQPGYNYVGPTNAHQPLHIKCCGQVARFPLQLTAGGEGGGRGTAPLPCRCSLLLIGSLEITPTHPADSGCPERPPTNTGWDTAVDDSGPTHPPSFPAPLTVSAGCPAVRTVPYTFS
jgi:hypothetical protein